MKLLSTIAAAGIASAASADLSFTFTFEELAIAGDGSITGSAFSGDPTEADFYGEQLISIDWDLSIDADDSGLLTAIIGSNALGSGWFTLNGLAGVPDLAVTAGETASFSGSFDATPYGISMVPATAFPYYMVGAAAFTADNGGSGILSGTITYNMTPAPGALALLGLAGMGRRRRS